MFNPHTVLELAGEAYVSLVITPMRNSWTLKLKAFIGSFSPFDLQFAWDTEERGRFCWRAGTFMKSLKMDLFIEETMDHCYYGVLGEALN